MSQGKIQYSSWCSLFVFLLYYRQVNANRVKYKIHEGWEGCLEHLSWNICPNWRKLTRLMLIGKVCCRTCISCFTKPHTERVPLPHEVLTHMSSESLATVFGSSSSPTIKIHLVPHSWLPNLKVARTFARLFYSEKREGSENAYKEKQRANPQN